jgi:hypothetical protein
MTRRVLTLGFLLALTACSNGGGTLEPVLEPGGEIAGFGDFSNGADKSFGIFICTRGGAVTVESIDVISIEGDIDLLGASIYTSSERFVGAVHGYPPAGIDETKLQDLEGAVVEADCEGPEGDDRVQLVVGAERAGRGGGQIDGLTVGTDAGEVEINFAIVLCGDELEYCEALLGNEDDGGDE